MKLDIQEEQRTVYVWKCTRCMRRMQSLWKKQLENFAKGHMESHGET